MRIFSQYTLLTIICLALSTLVGCASSTSNHTDEFERRRAGFWRSSNHYGNATSRSHISTDTARRGKYSYRFHVKQGDIITKSDPHNGTERQEFYTNTFDDFGSDIWYRFSIYIPEDFPDNFPVRPIVTGQWKHGEWGAGRGRSPFLSLRLEPDLTAVFILKNKMRPNGGFRHELAKLEKNRWYDVIVNFRLSLTNAGYYNVWLDGQKRISYQGITAQVNMPGYFKMGIYRQSMPLDMVIYFDSFARGNSPDDISVRFVEAAVP